MSVVTVRRRIRSGAIRAVKIHGRIRVDEHLLREPTGWGHLSTDAFTRDWDNPYDAVYDHWKRRRASSAR